MGNCTSWTKSSRGTVCFYWTPKQYQLCFLDDMGKPYFSYDVQYLIALLLVPTTLWHFGSWKNDHAPTILCVFFSLFNSFGPRILCNGLGCRDFFLVWELCKPSFVTGILGGEATQATAKVSTDCLFFGGVLSSRMLVSWWSGPSWIWNYINSGRGRFAYNTALAIQENMHAQKPNNGCPNNMYI